MRKEYLIKRLFAIFAIFASYTIVQASINPTISFLNSYAIDKNKKVGEIPCSTNVNDMGVVSINVPIESPTSPDGINPQISINYNSIGGSGILGYGWNLSATSIISCIGKSIYYDGITAPITTANTNAAYSLDGQRLIWITNDTLQTEQGFIKVVPITNNDLITQFYVYYPNGSISEYTLNDGTRFYCTKNTTINGMTTNYSYTHLPQKGHYRLNHITYGRNQEYKIRFEYNDNNGIIQFCHFYNRKYILDYSLSKIVSEVSSNEWRTYTMNYTNLYANGQRNDARCYFLTQINCSVGTEQLNPLLFYYNDLCDKLFLQKEEQLSEFMNFTEKDNICIERGKLEYGSSSDAIIMYANKEPYSLTDNRYNNEYNSTDSIKVNLGIGRPGQTIPTYNNFITALCMDAGFAPGDEFVTINNYSDNSIDKVDFHIYGKTTTSSIGQIKTLSVNSNCDLIKSNSICPKLFLPGDYDGDGYMEILMINVLDTSNGKDDIVGNLIKLNYYGNAATISQNTLFKAKIYFEGVTDVTKSKSDKIIPFDYDGDGKTDLCLINEEGMHLYTYNPQNKTWTKTMSHESLTSNIEYLQLLLGNLSDDRKSSLIGIDKSNGLVRVYRATGDSIDYVYATGLRNYAERFKNENCILQDLNEDGISDFILYRTSTQGGIHFEVLYMTPMCEISHTETGNYTNTQGEIILLPTDINSRNFYSRLTGVCTNGKVVSFNTYRDRTSDKLLTATINSMGVLRTFEYERHLNDSYDIFDENEYETPYQRYYGGLTTCIRQKVHHNSETFNDISYHYKDAVIHKQGLGFCGFSEVTIADTITHIKSVHKYSPEEYGILNEITEYHKGKDIRWTYFTYEINRENNGLLQILKEGEAKYDHENLQYGVDIYFQYDKYGNLLYSEEHLSGVTDPTTSHTYTYHNQTTPIYLLGVKTKEIHEETRDYKGSHQKTITNLKYSSDWKYLTSKSVLVNGEADGNHIAGDVYVYNSFGQVVTHHFVPYLQSTPITTTYTYDNISGRTTSCITAKGEKSNYAYNTKGQVVSITNENEMKTEYIYDNWGNIIRTNFPDGSYNTTTSAWGVDELKYGITQNTSGQPTCARWYDAFGREVLSETQSLFGESTKVSTQYDKTGEMTQVSFPYKTNKAAITAHIYDRNTGTITIADSYQRVETHTKTLNTSDRYIQYSSNVNGIQTTKKYNFNNEPISASDNGGTINYFYTAGGLLDSINVGNRFPTVYSYDSLGRKTTMKDPMAGTITLQYDNAGNVSSETDATGKWKKTNYDIYGRPIKIQYKNESTTIYTYNKKDQLLTETCNNGYKRICTYNNHYQLIKESISTGYPELSLIKLYTYSNGNIASIRYSQKNQNTGNEDLIGIEFFTYLNNNLSQISFKPALSPEIMVWQPTAENEMGLPTFIQSGPLTHQNTYDGYGQPLNHITSYNGSSIKNVSYTYNQTTGNMVSRSDNKRNLVEEFEYDSMNRLTSSTGRKLGTTITSHELTYDNLTGSITYNSLVGGDYWFNNQGKVHYRPSIIYSDFEKVSDKDQTISYNSMHRPSLIQQNGIYTQFYYNSNGDRIRTEVYKMTTSGKVNIENRYYIDDKYEATQKGTSLTKYLYIGGDAYSAPAVWVIDETGTGSMYYICRDHLGSITHIIDNTKQQVHEYSYDAWGNLRGPNTWTVGGDPNILPSELLLRRGFCGHEHLPNYDLINMNARLYEPTTGQFVSPDPYVQGAESTQGYNRYSYCLNNPLKYKDQNGEFFFSILNFAKELFVNTFIKVWDQGINAWTNGDNWHSTKMAFKIDMGLYKGNFKQILSRFTWEMPQTMLGYIGGHALNTANLVKNVSYYGGATAITTNLSNWGAFTLGSYITGDRNLEASPHNSLFQHEYGHYLQSQAWGPWYLGKAGIPSLLDTGGHAGDHNLHPIEQDANARAFEYFNKNVPGFYESTINYNPYNVNQTRGWNFNRNPLNINGRAFQNNPYVDYKREMDDVRNLKVSFQTIDYLYPIVLSDLSLGLYHHIRFNQTKVRKQ